MSTQFFIFFSQALRLVGRDGVVVFFFCEGGKNTSSVGSTLKRFESGLPTKHLKLIDFLYIPLAAEASKFLAISLGDNCWRWVTLWPIEDHQLKRANIFVVVAYSLCVLMSMLIRWQRAKSSIFFEYIFLLFLFSFVCFLVQKQQQKWYWNFDWLAAAAATANSQQPSQLGGLLACWASLPKQLNSETTRLSCLDTPVDLCFFFFILYKLPFTLKWWAYWLYQNVCTYR